MSDLVKNNIHCSSGRTAPMTPRIICKKGVKNREKQTIFLKNSLLKLAKMQEIYSKNFAKIGEGAKKTFTLPACHNSQNLFNLQDLLITFSPKQPVFENFGMIFERERERER
jgi:hypothetical protein